MATERQEQMTEVGQQLVELADLTPKEPVDRGDGVTVRADFYLSYEWHPGVGQDGGWWWEIEWEAVDARRNFSMSGVSLPELLDSAIERIKAEL